MALRNIIVKGKHKVQRWKIAPLMNQIEQYLRAQSFFSALFRALPFFGSSKFHKREKLFCLTENALVPHAVRLTVRWFEYVCAALQITSAWSLSLYPLLSLFIYLFFPVSVLYDERRYFEFPFNCSASTTVAATLARKFFLLSSASPSLDFVCYQPCGRRRWDHFCSMWNKLMRFLCVKHCKEQPIRAFYVYKVVNSKCAWFGLRTAARPSESCPNIVWEHAVFIKPFRMKSNTKRRHTTGHITGRQTRETTRTHAHKQKTTHKKPFRTLCRGKLNVFIISEEQIQFHRVVCILLTNRLSCFVSFRIFALSAGTLGTTNTVQNASNTIIIWYGSTNAVDRIATFRFRFGANFPIFGFVYLIWASASDRRKAQREIRRVAAECVQFICKSLFWRVRRARAEHAPSKKKS